MSDNIDRVVEVYKKNRRILLDDPPETLGGADLVLAIHALEDLFAKWPYQGELNMGCRGWDRFENVKTLRARRLALCEELDARLPPRAPKT